LLEVKVIPADSQNPENVDFTWELVEFKEDSVEI